MSKRDEQAREKNLHRLALGKSMLHQRLAMVHDELSQIMRGFDQLVLPRSPRRRSSRKSYVDRVGNLISFPRGDK